MQKGFCGRNSSRHLCVFQEFTVPDTGETLVRKGFIGLGAVEDYEAKIVHRHEQTFRVRRRTAGRCSNTPRLTSARSSCCIRTRNVVSMHSRLRRADPAASVKDEYGVSHTCTRVSDQGTLLNCSRSFGQETGDRGWSPSIRDGARVPQ